VTGIEEALRAFVDQFPADRPFALVGGLAVSARTEPRFTRDLDFAIATRDDAEAEGVVFAMQQRGFSVAATIEHTKAKRLATVRLRQHPRAPFVDLLFASCGAEPEIVAAATPLEVRGVTVPVATIGHLIAMKLVSRDDKLRPRDHQDLVALSDAADEVEWARAGSAVALVVARGFARDRDLVTALAMLRADD
jgi:hypothetical protein